MKKKLCALLMLGWFLLILLLLNHQKIPLEERRAFIEENMAVIGSQGPEKVDEWLAANGIHKAEVVQVVNPMSTPGSVALYNIAGYFDKLTKKYLIKGWWSWQGEYLLDNTAGALDSVSLAMYKTDWNPVTGYVLPSSPAGIAVYDQHGNYYPYAGGVSKIDKSGVVYTFQDAYEDNGYCGYKGQVWLWMDKTPTQLPIYVKMDFMHTWTSASLSSFGLSWPTNPAPTINLTFNSTPQNWKIANQITLRDWPLRD